MIANHSILGNNYSYHIRGDRTLVPHLVATLIYLSQMYSYYIRGDRSPLIYVLLLKERPFFS